MMATDCFMVEEGEAEALVVHHLRLAALFYELTDASILHSQISRIKSEEARAGANAWHSAIALTYQVYEND